ncbi:dihydrofolate reductase family protein [Saccharomonospora sp. NPDC046836]|uniref:dihydrofolate reductase family protein n=1 Tax=Saccharomonospora sp. NPDC046836 TaxID=3156921 RepID=UPI0033D57787
MNARPYVLLSVAASLDGFIDDRSDTRLLLSNDEDFDRVDEVRAGVDAILGSHHPGRLPRDARKHGRH